MRMLRNISIWYYFDDSPKGVSFMFYHKAFIKRFQIWDYLDVFTYGIAFTISLVSFCNALPDGFHQVIYLMVFIL